MTNSTSIPAPDEEPDPLVGSVVEGRYRVLRIIGQGGMGVVYEAEHQQLGTRVAFKVLGEHLTDNPKTVERFLREARTASRLQHPNIVSVTDLNRLPDGRPYMVMPLIAGEDLADHMRMYGAQSPARVAQLLVGVADALDMVHAKGVIHRDIKPENLMLVQREDGTEALMILDFGIAVLAAGNERRLTTQGVVCGTPDYLSPEALRREELDGRADVYALATLVFEWISGLPPFELPTVMLLLKAKVHDEPRRLSELLPGQISDELDAVVAKGLARDPSQRYQTAGELVRDLCVAVGVEYRAGVRAVPAQRSAELAASDSPRARGARAASGIDVSERATVQSSTADPATHGRGARRGKPLGAVLLALLAGAAGAGVLWPGREPEPKASTQTITPARPAGGVTAPATVPAPAPAPSIVPEPSVSPEPSVEAEPAPNADVSAKTVPRARSPAAKPPVKGLGAPRSQPTEVLAVKPAPLPNPPPAPTSAAQYDRPQAARLATQADADLFAGRLAAAVNGYTGATVADPTYPQAWKGLGLAQEGLGEVPAALRAYRRYLGVAKGAADAAMIRTRIERLEAERAGTGPGSPK